MANPTSYQRVTTATNYDAAAGLPYLRFDGVDDSLSTNSISFTSTDKMSVFAGVRKLSDAALAMVAELSSSVGSNNGVFWLLAPRANSTSSYEYSSKGTVQVTAFAMSGYSAPTTNVLTGIGDISGDLATLRINGTQAAQSTADQGTGNYGTYPLYIGRRAGSYLPFNGQLYSMIIVGKAVNEFELASTEYYINEQTGAY